MEEWFDISWQSVFAISANAVGIYIAIIIFTRLTGKTQLFKNVQL